MMSNTPRVLIVEDEPLISMMLQDYMEIIGFEVVAVVDCVPAAMALVGSQQFDLAIVDVNLAGGERCDPVAMALQERGIPFILSSGNDEPPGPWGVRPKLPKPYVLADVERVVAATTGIIAA